MNRFVKKLAAMGNLSEPAIYALEQATRDSRAYEARTDVIREGDSPGPLLVVLEGWACRYKMLANGSRQITAFLMPGDSCDLNVWILSEMDHSIQTLTAARIARISGPDLDKLFLAFPELNGAFRLSQLVDEGTLRAWIVSLGRRSSVERVSHLLLELYLRGAQVGMAEHDRMKFPFSQAVLSDALGMTAIHLNRVLQSLRRDKVIDLNRGLLHLTSVDGLVEICGFDSSYLHRRRTKQIDYATTNRSSLIA